MDLPTHFNKLLQQIVNVAVAIALGREQVPSEPYRTGASGCGSKIGLITPLAMTSTGLLLRKEWTQALKEDAGEQNVGDGKCNATF